MNYIDYIKQFTDGRCHLAPVLNLFIHLLIIILTSYHSSFFHQNISKTGNNLEGKTLGGADGIKYGYTNTNDIKK